MCKVTVETPLIPTTKQSRLFWMKSSEQIFAPLDIQVNYTLFLKNIYLITKRIIRTYTLMSLYHLFTQSSTNGTEYLLPMPTQTNRRKG